MSKKDNDKITVSRQKLEQISELLKFILTLNDEEIISSSIESVIEQLEDLHE